MSKGQLSPQMKTMLVNIHQGVPFWRDLTPSKLPVIRDALVRNGLIAAESSHTPHPYLTESGAAKAAAIDAAMQENERNDH